MTTRRNIAIDIDGVLAEFNRPFAHLLSARAQIPVDTFTFTDWYWFKKAGISPEIVRQAWDDIIYNPKLRMEFWGRLAVINEAETLMSIAELFEDGYEVAFVTARNALLFDVTRSWLRHRLCVPDPYLIHTPKKDYLCEALNTVAFIDDKYENCLDVLRMRGTKTLVTLRDQSYNRFPSPNPYLHRLSGMRAFFELLRSQAPGRGEVQSDSLY